MNAGEPATCGRVVLETSVGELEIELWSRQCGVACKNFLQHCVDDYYNGCEFFRVLKGELAMTGDPSNTGFGGVSSFDGLPYFHVETHPRLRFTRRGLIGMVRVNPESDSYKQQNGSQFFVTFNRCDVLNGNSTVFGRLTEETLWNALRIDECVLDETEGREDRPLVPPKIFRARILEDPFECCRKSEQSDAVRTDEEPDSEPDDIPEVSDKPALVSFRPPSFHGVSETGDDREEEEDDDDDDEFYDDESDPHASRYRIAMFPMRRSKSDAAQKPEITSACTRSQTAKQECAEPDCEKAHKKKDKKKKKDKNKDEDDGDKDDTGPYARTRGSLLLRRKKLKIARLTGN